MNKGIPNLLLILILSLINISSVHAISFPFFGSKQDEAEIELVIRQKPDAPLRIIKSKIKDLGVSNQRIKEVANTFTFQVQNLSKETIIAYKIQIKEYHPFQDVKNNEFSLSSVKKIEAGKKTKIYEQQVINENIDTLYITSVSEVLFEDGTIWTPGEGIIKP